MSKGALLKVTADTAPRRRHGRMLSLLHAAVCKQDKVTRIFSTLLAVWLSRALVLLGQDAHGGDCHTACQGQGDISWRLIQPSEKLLKVPLLSWGVNEGVWHEGQERWALAACWLPHPSPPAEILVVLLWQRLTAPKTDGLLIKVCWTIRGPVPCGSEKYSVWLLPSVPEPLFIQTFSPEKSGARESACQGCELNNNR